MSPRCSPVSPLLSPANLHRLPQECACPIESSLGWIKPFWNWCRSPCCYWDVSCRLPCLPLQWAHWWNHPQTRVSKHGSMERTVHCSDSPCSPLDIIPVVGKSGKSVHGPGAGVHTPAYQSPVYLHTFCKSLVQNDLYPSPLVHLWFSLQISSATDYLETLQIEQQFYTFCEAQASPSLCYHPQIFISSAFHCSKGYS